MPFLSKLIFCTKDLWLCVNKESWGKVVPSKRKIPIEQTCNINIFSQQQETFVITKTQTTYDDSHYLHFVSKMINCKLTKKFFEFQTSIWSSKGQGFVIWVIWVSPNCPMLQKKLIYVKCYFMLRRYIP